MSHPETFLLAGVMGWPVMHSRSPKLHSYWLERYGLAGAYLPLAIQPDGLERALRALGPLGFAGCKMARRIVGVAHVADFETITDIDVRARCERRALRFGRRLLVEAASFTSIEAVTAANVATVVQAVPAAVVDSWIATVSDGVVPPAVPMTRRSA